MEEKVSIIIPIYNVEPYLDECLNSVLNQTYKNLEVLMINDGSTDNCEKICKRYAEQDKRFLYFYKENGGLSDARNYGLDRMTGDYVFFLDSDDLILEDTIQKLINAIKKNDIDIASCMSFRKKGVKKKTYSVGNKVSNIEYMRMALVSIKHAENAWGKLYKKFIFKEYRYKKGYSYEDLFAIIDILSITGNIYILNDELYFYRKRNDSIMNNTFNKGTLDILDVCDYNLNLVEKEFPELLDCAIFRRHYSRFYVLDKTILSKDEKARNIKEAMYDYIKKNAKNIIRDKYLSKKRKIGCIIILISTKLYERILTTI